MRGTGHVGCISANLLGDARGHAIMPGCTHAGLAAAGSLSRRGIDLTILSYKAEEFRLASRYVKDWHLYPHARKDQVFIDTDDGTLESVEMYVDTESAIRARMNK